MRQPASQPGDRIGSGGGIARAREENREDDKNGHRPNVHQDLGEPDELGVQLQVCRSEPRESHREGQRAMDDVAQAHRRNRRGHRHTGNHCEREGHAMDQSAKRYVLF